MERVFARHGFVVFPAASVAEAVEYCKRPENEVDLLIADVPFDDNATGTAAARQFREACPQIPLLLVSDTALEHWPEPDFQHFKQLLRVRVDFLRKPLSPASFVSRVNALLYKSSSSAGQQVFDAAALLRPHAAAV